MCCDTHVVPYVLCVKDASNLSILWGSLLRHPGLFRNLGLLRHLGLFLHVVRDMSFVTFVLWGGLRWVGALKLQVSFAKEPYKRDDILQKRPTILRHILIVSTPFIKWHRCHDNSSLQQNIYFTCSKRARTHTISLSLYRYLHFPKNFTKQNINNMPTI